MNEEHNEPSAFCLSVRDAFRFSDGSTVFVGTVEPPVKKLVRVPVDVVVDGRKIGRVTLTEERMPGPLSIHERTVVTHDGVDIGEIRSGRCLLLHQKGR